MSQLCLLHSVVLSLLSMSIMYARRVHADCM